MPDIRCLHGLQQGNRIDNIVAVILQRFLDGLPNQRVCGKVHHGLDWILPEDLCKPGRISQVAFNEFTARHQFTVTAGEVVEGNNRIIRAQQIEHHVRADVTGAADNQDRWFTHLADNCVPSLEGTTAGMQEVVQRRSSCREGQGEGVY